MFASTFISAAAALFFFAPSSVVAAPVYALDITTATAKVASVQAVVVDTKVKLTGLVAKVENIHLTVETVQEYVAGITAMTEVIADCKSKVDDIKYRTLGVHVGADVNLKAVVGEIDAMLVVVARLVLPLAANVEADVLVTVESALHTLGATINGLLIDIDAVLAGVLALVLGVVGNIYVTLVETLRIAVFIHA